jgi:ankyrin repeat protein
MMSIPQWFGLGLLSLALGLGGYRLNTYQYPQAIDPISKRWVPAINANDTFSVSQLIQRYSAQDVDAYGNTPLHYACASYLRGEDNIAINTNDALLKAHERPDLIRHLLLQGANPNQVNRAGWSPLHYCVMHSHLQSVNILLDAQANPNLLDKSGVSPLAVAKAKQLGAVEKLLTARLD